MNTDLQNQHVETRFMRDMEHIITERRENMDFIFE